METIWKTYNKYIDFIKIDNLISTWLHKFQTNSLLPLTEIDSFEKEFFLGELHLWLTTEKNPSMAKVITEELVPKLVRLRKLHHRVDGTTISRDQKKRIIRMQRRIVETIREVARWMPP